MAYKSLTELRNQYPSERNVVQSYETKNNSIAYKGRYNENSLNFTIEDLSGVSVIDGTSFNFILKIDGTEYTSPSFKSFLENSLKSDNPYIQKSTVMKVVLSSEELLTAENFDTREKYAEVEVTKNLKTIEEIVSHIDWLVGKTQTLRNIEDYGEYSLYTTEYDVLLDVGDVPPNDPGLGMIYSDSVQSGEPYVSSNETVTTQPDDASEVGKTLTTEITTTTPTDTMFTSNVTFPISYNITNPITNFRFSFGNLFGLRNGNN